MRIAICDDEINALKQTCEVVKSVFSEMNLKYTINEFTDADELLSKKTQYDIAFLDIELRNFDKNGVWVAQTIKRENPNCIIIFTTNHEEYIDEVIEKYAFRYWSKPIDRLRLHRSINSILERMKTITVEIYDTKQSVELLMRNIIYITPENKHCKVITTLGEYVVNKSFKEFKEYFTTQNFCECHGSYYVNLDYVEKYTKSGVCLAYENNKYEVHMSRRFYKTFKEQMFITGGDKV